MKIIVGISGASGVIIGYKLLLALREIKDMEIHLVVTEGAKKTIELETNLMLDDYTSLADVYYDNYDMAAAISSGSFKTDGMIIAPCSMKTLSAIANSYDESLIVRAADVCLKESRKVVLCPREMPLNVNHLRNMTNAAIAGCAIVPPMVSFYGDDQSADAMVNQIVGKILMQFNIDYDHMQRWEGDK